MANLWKNRTVVIVGVGSGLGIALARRFAGEGCAVAAVGRSERPLQERIGTLRKETGGRLQAFAGDCTEAASVEQTFAAIRNWNGPVGGLIYNASGATWKGLANGDAEGYETAWRNTTFGAYLCAKAGLDDMIAEGDGVMLFTGATSSVRGRAGAIDFSAAKFGLRGFAQSAAVELGPKNIHVAHFLIDGVIDTEHELPEGEQGPNDDPLLRPDDIAASYWAVASQAPSAWTFEMDLRPRSEAFFE